MQRGHMPPPSLQRVANQTIREDQSLQDFYSNSDKMHRADPANEFTQAWLYYGRSSFPQSVRKTGTNVDFFLKFQRTSVASSPTSWVPSTGRVNSGIRKTREPEQAFYQK